MGLCVECGKERKNYTGRYCSNKCQNDYEYYEFIEAWLFGLVDGGTGVNARSISGHIKRYMANKYSKGCAICGWNEINKVTGKIPLEIDHIDGDSENNQESNLRMICPNCHSLTPNFRNLNKGRGRSWRRVKYVKVKQ